MSAPVSPRADLLARVEAATGPSRELDCLIEAYVKRFKEGGTFQTVGPPTYSPQRCFYNPDPELGDWIGYDLLTISPIYTASLDAVVGLLKQALPSMFGWSIEFDDEPSFHSYEATISWRRGLPHRGSGVTAPLALLEALLSALIAQEQTHVS